MLASDWRIEEGPPRRYYKLNAKGARLYEELKANWRGLIATMDRLLD